MRVAKCRTKLLCKEKLAHFVLCSAIQTFIFVSHSLHIMQVENLLQVINFIRRYVSGIGTGTTHELGSLDLGQGFPLLLNQYHQISNQGDGWRMTMMVSCFGNLCACHRFYDKLNCKSITMLRFSYSICSCRRRKEEISCQERNKK